MPCDTFTSKVQRLHPGAGFAAPFWTLQRPGLLLISRTFLRYVSSYHYDHPMLSGWRGDMPFFLISRPRRVAQSTQVESFSFEALSLEVPNGYNSIVPFRRQRWCVIHALYSHTPQPSMDRSPCTNGHISGRCGSKAAALPRLSLWKFQREIHPSDRITESSSM